MKYQNEIDEILKAYSNDEHYTGMSIQVSELTKSDLNEIANYIKPLILEYNVSVIRISENPSILNLNKHPR